MHRAQHWLDRSQSGPTVHHLDPSLAAGTPTITTLQAIPFDSSAVLYRQHHNGRHL